MANKTIVNETKKIAALFGSRECLSSAVQERPFCYDSSDLESCAMTDILLLNKDKPEYSAAANEILMNYESWQVKNWLDIRTHISDCEGCNDQYRMFRTQMAKHPSEGSLNWFAMENLIQKIGTSGIKSYLMERYDAEQVSKEIGQWSDEEVTSVLEMGRGEKDNPQRFNILESHLDFCRDCSQNYAPINAAYERLHKGLTSGLCIRDLLERERMNKKKFFEMLVKQSGAYVL